MTFDKAPSNVIQLRDKIQGKTMVQPAIGARVISIASGKGGVGKTNIVANLGYSFCEMGKKVLIFDADLGLGNLDILLGLTPKYNLSHFLLGEKALAEIIVEGPSGMKIIPAASGIKELAQLTKEQRTPFLNKIDSLVNDFDVFLIDTGAGISSNVLHFTAMAQDVMVVVSPEPTALTDAYALIKVLSYHYGIRQFNLVVNMVKTETEAKEVFRQLEMVTGRFLDVSLHYIGHVLTDAKMTKGVRRQRIVCDLYPDADASKCFLPLAQTMLRQSTNDRSTPNSNLIWHSLLNF